MFDTKWKIWKGIPQPSTLLIFFRFLNLSDFKKVGPVQLYKFFSSDFSIEIEFFYSIYMAPIKSNTFSVYF